MRGIPHYMLDVTSPRRAFTAYEYEKLATSSIKKILKKGRLPIICGGTGLYIDAVLHPMRFPNVSPSPRLRKKLGRFTAEALFMKLKKTDPERARTIDPKNKRRLIRALEIVLTTKNLVPKSRISQSPYNVLKIGIRIEPQKLKRRIARRLSQRMRRGLIKEVEHLHKKGLSWKRLKEFGLEYREVSRYLRSMITKEKLIRSLKNENWHYAKRQMTWFKRDPEIHWFSGDTIPIEKKVRNFLQGTRAKARK